MLRNIKATKNCVVHSKIVNGEATGVIEIIKNR